MYSYVNFSTCRACLLAATYNTHSVLSTYTGIQRHFHWDGNYITISSPYHHISTLTLGLVARWQSLWSNSPGQLVHCVCLSTSHCTSRSILTKQSVCPSSNAVSWKPRPFQSQIYKYKGRFSILLILFFYSPVLLNKSRLTTRKKRVVWHGINDCSQASWVLMTLF